MTVYDLWHSALCADALMKNIALFSLDREREILKKVKFDTLIRHLYEMTSECGRIQAVRGVAKETDSQVLVFYF